MRPFIYRALFLLVFIGGSFFFLVKSSRGPREPAFSKLCMRPTRLTPIRPAVTQRVKGLKDLIEKEAKRNDLPPSWIQTIIAHESGGKLDAVSPTGCAGAMALCYANRWDPRIRPCCPRPQEAKSLYEDCVGRTPATYTCTPTDPRFNASYSIAQGSALLAKTERSLSKRERAPFWAIAGAYNAGVAVMMSSTNLQSLEGTAASLSISSSRRYGTWSDEDIVRKTVEVIDYIHWAQYLEQSFREEETPPRDISSARWCCLDAKAATFDCKSVPFQADLKPLTAYRLEYGYYRPEEVFWKK